MKKLKLSAVTAAFLMASTVHAAEFNHVLIGGSENDYVGSVIATKDGYVGCGRTVNANTSEIFVFKVDLNARELWKKPVLQGQKLFWQGATCNQIIETAEGNFMIVGGTTSLGNPQRLTMYLAQLDHNGVKNWERSYSAPNRDYDFGFSIVNTDNGYLLNATSTFTDAFTDPRLVEIDSFGNELATQYPIRSPYETVTRSLLALSDGYILSGYDGLWNWQDESKLLIAKVDLQGKLIWQKRISSEFTWKKGTESNWGNANVLSSSLVIGNVVYSTGFLLNASGDRDAVLLANKTDDGALLFKKMYGQVGVDETAHSLSFNPITGTFFITGRYINSANNADGFVLETDLNGNLLNSDSSSFGGEGSDILNGIAFHADGSHILYGTTNSATKYGTQNSDVWLLTKRTPNQTCSEIIGSNKVPMMLAAKFEWANENGYILADGDAGLIKIQGDASEGSWRIDPLVRGEFDVDAVILKGATGTYVYNFSTEAVGRGKFSKNDLPLNKGGQAPDISNVNFCQDGIVTDGNDETSYIRISRRSGEESLEYVTTMSVEEFDSLFKENQDYRVVTEGTTNYDYVLEGINDAGETTTLTRLIRLQ
jgi:hypothetical protein